MVDFTPLRESRDFRVLFAGQSISTLGNQLTTVAIPYQVYSMTHSSFQVGLISLAQLLPLIIGFLGGGAFGDVIDRRSLLMGSGGASALVAGVLAWNAASASPSLWVLYVVSALAAGLVGFANPSRNAAIPMLVKPTQLVAAYSFNQVSFQLAIIAGPALAGVLLAKAGFTVAVPAEAHICCGSAGTYNLMQPEIAGQLRERKLANLEAVKPDLIAAGNIGCITQLSGTALPVVHSVALLDWMAGGPRPGALS